MIEWAVFVASMSLIWIAVFWKLGSLRKASIVALFWGKTLAVVYWAVGLDKTLAYLIISLRNGPLVLSITATKLIFLAFLATNLVLISWPLLYTSLPKELKIAFKELT